MDTPTKRRVCVRGIVYKNGKLFCQELKNSDGTGRGFWCTPGGGLDPKESLIEGVRRELIEETGVEPVVGKLLFVQQYSEHDASGEHHAHEFLEFFFHIENPDDFETIDENASHFEAEILRYGFVDPATSNVLPAFLTTIDIEAHIAHDKPVYFHTEFNQN
jgi:8-oxo-dGTP pyrophosphatase MutT (NUDIX family)